jgi:hypothetical protein
MSDPPKNPALDLRIAVGIMGLRSDTPPQDTKDYCSDADYAQQMAKEMGEQGFSMQTPKYDATRRVWVVTFTDSAGGSWSGEAEKDKGWPEAACLAALRAKGLEP